MRRREFIAGLGGAAVGWPLLARAQQKPVIGYLYLGWSEPESSRRAFFHRGLAEAGYVDGQNVTINYRFAEGRFDRLPDMAAELARRNVNVIVTANNNAAALAAKAATTSIPIVFSINDDPVKFGLVTSLSRPGGNLTGINFLLGELGTKKLGLLRELVPTVARVGFLVNPKNPGAASQTRELTAAASAIGVQIDVLQAGDIHEIEAGFDALKRSQVVALVVAPDTLFFNRRIQVAILAARHGIAAVYSTREYVDSGGLLSYGTSQAEVYRQLGIYTAHILKGARPADLPVIQSRKFELIINLPTARALGLTVPPQLLARADEVIE